MKHTVVKHLARLLVLPLIVGLSGCGTILHPERKGQVDGRIDPGVALLNGVGLLFFFVPGVIAFAVDFSNGTIYLPGGSSADASAKREVQQISFTGKPDAAELERLIREQGGVEVDFDNAVILGSDGYVALTGDMTPLLPYAVAGR